MARQIRFTPTLDNARFLEKIRRQAEELRGKRVTETQVVNCLLGYLRTRLELDEASPTAEEVLQETGY